MQNIRTRFLIIWGGWIAWFLFWEIPAVFNGVQGDTFSEFFWALLHINDNLPLWMAIPVHGTVLIFGLWLTLHMAFGWFGGPKKLPQVYVMQWLDDLNELNIGDVLHVYSVPLGDSLIGKVVVKSK